MNNYLTKIILMLRRTDTHCFEGMLKKKRQNMLVVRFVYRKRNSWGYLVADPNVVAQAYKSRS